MTQNIKDDTKHKKVLFLKYFLWNGSRIWVEKCEKITYMKILPFRIYKKFTKIRKMQSILILNYFVTFINITFLSNFPAVTLNRCTYKYELCI